MGKFKFSFHITDYLPILSWLPAYIKNSPQKHIGGDIMAGLTVIKIFKNYNKSFKYKIIYSILIFYILYNKMFKHSIGWCTYYATSYCKYIYIYIYNIYININVNK